MIEGKKKLIMTMVTVLVTLGAGIAAHYGLNLDATTQAELIGALTLIASTLVGFYLQRQSKVDIARATAIDSGTIRAAIATIQPAIVAEVKNNMAAHVEKEVAKIQSSKDQK